MNIIGIMTGNSLDACDLVLTCFNEEGMRDLKAGSFVISKTLQKEILLLKKRIQQKKIILENIENDSFFQSVHFRYVKWVASSVKKFLKENKLSSNQIDLIGFHGQTLDHNPPSVAGSFNEVYTLQMGSGALLSDLTGIPVVYDFRSDDVINGGEGAPLMPPHNEHFALSLGLKNAVFYNAGNTSNLAVIKNGKVVQGFDAGPFNEFSDYLVRFYKNELYDKDSVWGLKGSLDIDLLKELFDKSAFSKKNENFFMLTPPKSADPSLYGFKKNLKPLNDKDFYKQLHTVQYFAGYVAAYSLKYILGANLPNEFVLFGGGWKNKVSFQAFKNLLEGTGVELAEHKEIFQKIRASFLKKPIFLFPDGSEYMEARLMADLAYFFEQKKIWTCFELTGVKVKTVLGQKKFPSQNRTVYDDCVSRANKGWQKKLKQ